MNKTKKALFCSVLTICLCTAMLVGTTFAWFTDSASTGVNRIQSGNLDVDLLMDKDGAATEESYVSIANDTFSDIFTFTDQSPWEPGKTKVAYLAVENKGSLAIKYNIKLQINDEGLAGALDYAIVDEADNTATYTDWNEVKAAAGSQTGNIGALLGGSDQKTITAAPNGRIENKDGRDYFVLAVHMNEEAGNEYKGKTCDIDITVDATQAAHEEDSFGADYDADAPLPEAVPSVAVVTLTSADFEADPDPGWATKEFTVAGLTCKVEVHEDTVRELADFKMTVKEVPKEEADFIVTLQDEITEKPVKLVLEGYVPIDTTDPNHDSNFYKNICLEIEEATSLTKGDSPEWYYYYADTTSAEHPGMRITAITKINYDL